MTPITTKSFIPNVLIKKNAPPKPKPVKPVKPVTQQSQEPAISDDSDDDEEELQIDLFEDEDWKILCGRKKKSTPKPTPEITETETDIRPLIIDSKPDVSEPYSGLDNTAFKQLVGSSKTKRQQDIRVLDINEEEILPDKDLWLTKALTDPECTPKYVVQDPVNDTCKRKHHITYLAQQAKANEQELQNQWSQSKYSRKQTQMKYGF